MLNRLNCNKYSMGIHFCQFIRWEIAVFRLFEQKYGGNKGGTSVYLVSFLYTLTNMLYFWEAKQPLGEVLSIHKMSELYSLKISAMNTSDNLAF